jgi:hypothetical protein
MSYKVFISASPEDADLAEDLRRQLGKAHIDVAFQAADARRNLAALDGADELVALVTDRSLDDEWMMFAMGAASSLRKPVTQVVEGMDRRPLPPFLQGIPHVRYGDLEQFLAGVQARAGSHPPKARAAAR